MNPRQVVAQHERHAAGIAAAETMHADFPVGCLVTERHGRRARVVSYTKHKVVIKLDQGGCYHKHAYATELQRIDEPQPMNPPQKKKPDAKRPSMRQIFLLLEDHYDTGTHQYDTDWSDERVAKDADCSPDYVAEIREKEFGPLEDPRIGDMRVEINRARAAIKHDAATLRALIDDAERKSIAKLDELGTKLTTLMQPN